MSRIMDIRGSGQEAPAYTMKIYFCDICNESIPLKDINSNRITIEEGKIFCQKCAPKKARSVERVPGFLLAIVFLLVIGGIVLAVTGWRLTSDLDQAQQELSKSVGGLERHQPTLDQRIEKLHEGVAELARRLDRLGDDLTTTRTELQQRFNDLESRERTNHEAQKAVLEKAVAELAARRGDGEDLKRLADQVQQLDADVRGQATEIGVLRDLFRDRVEIVESRRAPTEPSTEAPPAAPEAAADGVAPDAMEEREVNSLIAQLSDRSAGKRYSAVLELSKYSGPKVVKALETVLADEEDWIRMTAIQVLRKLSAVRSVPLIINALRDRDVYVRSAALDALRLLTGANIEYDPEGSATEREVMAKKWEEWWTANRERVLKASTDGD